MLKPDGSEDDALLYQEEAKTSPLQKILIVVVVLLVCSAIATALAFIGIAATRPGPDHWENCTDQCSVILAESIPVNLTYPPGSPSHVSTYETWMNLINMATKSIDIASYYWTLRGQDIYTDPTDKEGEDIFNALMEAGRNRSIAIRIAQNKPDGQALDNDTQSLQDHGAAQVRSLDFNRLIGAGILHTKMWVIDGKHVFIGSPNMDWRSLTQVKELGVAFLNCSCVARDAAKLFEVYWTLGAPGATVPSSWPANYSTPYNAQTPMQIQANGTESNVYLSSAPPQFCPDGRTQDLDAILDVMDQAMEFIHVSVMDYYPFLAYGRSPKFWPVLNDKLSSAAYDRKVKVQLMVSTWQHSYQEMFGFLRSLAALNTTGVMNFEVKLFKVPATPEQAKIPFARVNHCKFMVTDKHAYVGTSNWSEDYFEDTGGVGVVLNQTSSSSSRGPEGNSQSTLRQQLADVFERDWNSDYATFIALR